MEMRFLHIAAVTLDGKIARSSDHLSTDWTSEEDKKTFRALLKTCDVFVLGNNTYKTAVKPLSKRNCVVFSGSESGKHGKRREHENLLYIAPTSADDLILALQEAVEGRSAQKTASLKVAVLGGTSVYDWCAQQGLLDTLVLTVEPVVFGAGLPLFSSGVLEDTFVLVSSEQLNSNGTLLLTYQKKQKS